MRVALVTCSKIPDLDPDEIPFRDELRARGHAAEAVVWDDPAVDWHAYDVVLPRSTWDYHLRRDEFLAWAARAAEATRLFNPLPLLRWNTHKGYLAELSAAGAPVTPTVLLRAGERAHLADLLREKGWTRAVIKPAVGADGFGAALVTGDDSGQAQFDRLLAGRDVLVQPYVRAVEEPGERCLVHIDGRFSHAVRKRSLFQGGRHVGPEGVPVEAAEDEIEVAREVLARAAAASGVGDPLYARVDLLRDEGGRPALLELELAEPTLFFAVAPGSAARMADALEARVRGGSGGAVSPQPRRGPGFTPGPR